MSNPSRTVPGSSPALPQKPLIDYTVNIKQDDIRKYNLRENKTSRPNEAPPQEESKNISTQGGCLNYQAGVFEEDLKSQHNKVSIDVQKIKSGMNLAIENMGDSIPEKTRKQQYIESTGLRKLQNQERYLRYILTGKGIK